MSTHRDAAVPHTEEFVGASGNRLVADRYGDAGAPVLLLHGGGQTRHAWAATAAALAGTGRVAYTLDQRGHGDSAWVDDGDYHHTAFADDARCVGAALLARHGSQPAAIGASFGGLIVLLAQRREAVFHQARLFRALVLVDMTLQTDKDGARRIRAFMRAHLHDGFASVDEAADVVAAYTPNRPRPRSTRGLQKNLRQGADGRWRWHWDPRFMEGPRWIDSDREAIDAELHAGARAQDVPTLLVRGASSDLVLEAHAQAFLAIAPRTEYVNVAGARHMLVGDANDLFTASLTGFLERTGGAPA